MVIRPGRAPVRSCFKSDFPRRSALNLTFNNTTVFDPRITFTRASSATFTNSAGLIASATTNTPRIDYDPVTLAAKGLLIEEARTNLLLRSEEFDNAAWTKGRSSISANAVTAPDGTLTADKLVEDATASNSHYITQAATTSPGSTYTYSVFVKASERGYIQLGSWDGTTGIDCVFNVSSGVVSITGAGGTASIVNWGNGWYRCSVSRVCAGTGLALYLYLYNGASITYTGDGTSGLFIWGAQLEAGAFPTSYIPTVASQVTRAADVAVMTGSNFSSWWNASEGTLVCESTQLATGAAAAQYMVCEAGVNAANNDELIGIGTQFGTTNFQVLVQDGGVAQLAILEAAYLTSARAALAYKVNDFALSRNGAAVTADAAGTLPTVNQFNIGSRPAFGNIGQLNGWVKRITYYPTRLPNATLQALTA